MFKKMKISLGYLIKENKTKATAWIIFLLVSVAGIFFIKSIDLFSDVRLNIALVFAVALVASLFITGVSVVISNKLLEKNIIKGIISKTAKGDRVVTVRDAKTRAKAIRLERKELIRRERYLRKQKETHNAVSGLEKHENKVANI